MAKYTTHPSGPPEPSTTPPPRPQPPSSIPAPLVGLMTVEDWTKYVDLLIRLLAIVFAWLKQNEPKPPTDSSS